MKFKISYLIFILGVFLMVGCQGGGGGEGGAPRTPFIGGSNGILIEFEEGNPPDEVIDDGSFGFQALVRLKNDGEFSVEQNRIKLNLVGIDPNDFSTSLNELKNKHPEDDLLSKRRDAEGNFIEGTISYVTFPNEYDELVPRRFEGNIDFTLRAEACYQYETRAVSLLCVLSDLINYRDDRFCDPSGNKPIYSSGSPIHVTNFRQSVSGKDKIGFNFDISHNNNGNVFKLGDGSDFADCPKDSRERRNALNKVYVKVKTGIPNLKCVGLSGGSGTEGYVRLTGGTRSVACYQGLGADRIDGNKEVTVTLEYNYEDYIESNILVKHLIDE